VKVYVEPIRIDFHMVLMSTFGGAPVGIEEAAPEFECEFQVPGGGHGRVVIPLTPDERAYLREIVITASQRARKMAEGLAAEAVVPR
jgi:hypothetical protein